MINITQGMEVAELRNLLVVSPGGQYEDTALIECKDAQDSSKPPTVYQAQFVKYGSIVYRFSDPRDLGAEILKLDPESSHSAAVFVRISSELLAQMSEGSLEPTALDDAKAKEQEKTAEQNPDPVPEDEVEDLPTEQTSQEPQTNDADMQATSEGSEPPEPEVSAQDPAPDVEEPDPSADAEDDSVIPEVIPPEPVVSMRRLKVISRSNT